MAEIKGQINICPSDLGKIVGSKGRSMCGVGSQPHPYCTLLTIEAPFLILSAASGTPPF